MAYGKDRDSWEAASEETLSPALYRIQNPGMQERHRPIQATRRNQQDTRREYSDIDGRGTYRSNSDIDWSRTSFKIKKPKPGKIKVLSKGEMFGIAMSFLLSVCIAVIMALMMVYLTPIVSRNFMNFLYDIQDIGSRTKDTLLPPKPTSVNVTVIDSLSAEAFQSLHYRKSPSRFILRQFDNQNLHFGSTIGIAKPSVTIRSTNEKKPSGSLSWEQFMGSEFASLNIAQNSSLFAQVAFNETEMTLVNSLWPITGFNSLFTPPSASNLYLKNGVYTNSRLIEVSDGFLALSLRGSLRWLLFQPDRIPKGGYNNIATVKDILLSDEATLQKQETVRIFVQREGEFVYIPQGWLFGFEVASDTKDFVTSLHFGEVKSDPSSYHQFYMSAKEKLENGDIAGAIRHFKLGLSISRNALLLEGLADAMQRNEQFIASEEFYREALSLNPKAVTVYSKLIHLLITHANRDISDEVTDLLVQAEKSGVKDHVLSAVQSIL